MTRVKREFRIAVAPVEIAGIASGLTCGFRELGFEARALFGMSNEFKYEGDVSASWLLKIWTKAGDLRREHKGDKIEKRAFFALVHNFLGWPVFLNSLFFYNAYIFIFGQTFTNSTLELWLLRLFKKKIIFVYVGSDSRPPYLDGARFPGLLGENLPDAKHLLREVKRVKRKIKRHEKFADYLVNAPATAHFHERPYVNWFCLGIPRMMPSENIVQEDSLLMTPRISIVHSPSNSSVKGTKEILSILNRIQDKGIDFDFIKLEHTRNEDVLREISKCDFVIDQMYADTPMAGFATEAAMYGKPAVVGGYFAAVVRSEIPDDITPPSLFVQPHEVEEAIERMIIDHKLRFTLGNAAQSYIVTKWSLERVASNYLKLLNDEVPKKWLCDPQLVNYIGGCGLPIGRIAHLVNLLLVNFGVSALSIDDKKKLRSSLVDFSRSFLSGLND